MPLVLRDQASEGEAMKPNTSAKARMERHGVRINTAEIDFTNAETFLKETGLAVGDDLDLEGVVEIFQTMRVTSIDGGRVAVEAKR